VPDDRRLAQQHGTGNILAPELGGIEASYDG
jgi:hypothetical protein